MKKVMSQLEKLGKELARTKDLNSLKKEGEKLLTEIRRTNWSEMAQKSYTQVFSNMNKYKKDFDKEWLHVRKEAEKIFNKAFKEAQKMKKAVKDPSQISRILEMSGFGLKKKKKKRKKKSTGKKKTTTSRKKKTTRRAK